MALINVPNPGQSLSDSRPSINANFATIDASFLVDHVDYNVAGQGKHRKVTLIDNAGAAFLAGEMGMFNKTAAPTARPDIWVSRGVAAPYPLTGYNNINVGASAGWTYLPSGMKMVWNTSTIVAGGQVTITYAVSVPGFPGFSTFWGPPQLTRAAPAVAATNNFVVLQAFTATTMTVFSSQLGNNVTFSWLAFGL